MFGLEYPSLGPSCPTSIDVSQPGGTSIAVSSTHTQHYSRPMLTSHPTDVLSIGLTVGASISGILQFFAITYPGVTFTWWGRTFYASGCDGLGCPIKPLPEQGFFGPAVSQSSERLRYHSDVRLSLESSKLSIVFILSGKFSRTVGSKVLNICISKVSSGFATGNCYHFGPIKPRHGNTYDFSCSYFDFLHL